MSLAIKTNIFLNSPKFIQKIAFLQKHSKIVSITKSTVSSNTFSIHLNDLTDCEPFSIETKDLLDLLKINQPFEIEGEYLKYSYETPVGDKIAKISKKVGISNVKYEFEFENPLLTAKINKFKVLSTDKTHLIFEKNRLILETKGYIRTRSIIEVQRIDGVEKFEIIVSGKDLKIVEELGEDIVMCYYKDCIVIFKFEDEISLSMIIRNVIQ